MSNRSHASKSSRVALWVALVLLGACDPSSTDPAGLEPSEVVVGDSLTFEPSQLAVTAGTPVRFTNVGPFAHTITSGPRVGAADRAGAEFDMELAPGGSVEITFGSPGDHPYFSRPYEARGARGVVTVVGQAGGD